MAKNSINWIALAALIVTLFTSAAYVVYASASRDTTQDMKIAQNERRLNAHEAQLDRIAEQKVLLEEIRNILKGE